MTVSKITRSISLFLALLALAGFAVAIILLNKKASPPTTTDGLTIGATIFPLADIARQVGGEHVNVIQIIPPGVTEHSNALSPEQLRQLQNAQVIFRIDHNLDTILTEKIKNITPTAPLITVDQGITIRPFDGGSDPHYWLTVPNGKQIATTIAKKLAEIDPAHQAEYSQNLVRYSAELDALEAELQTMAASASAKKFMTMHNAWGYLAEQYGFTVVATYEPVEGREPSLADLQHLQKIIDTHNLHVFYSEPQKQSTGATRLLQNDFGLEIRTLDPVGGLPPADSYINLMRANLRALTTPAS